MFSCLHERLLFVGFLPWWNFCCCCGATSTYHCTYNSNFYTNCCTNFSNLLPNFGTNFSNFCANSWTNSQTNFWTNSSTHCKRYSTADVLSSLFHSHELFQTYMIFNCMSYIGTYMCKSSVHTTYLLLTLLTFEKVLLYNLPPSILWWIFIYSITCIIIWWSYCYYYLLLSLLLIVNFYYYYLIF